VSPLDTSEWSKWASNSSGQACRVRPSLAIPGMGQPRRLVISSVAGREPVRGQVSW
jgi:hypothetical protein